jgi:hypothetical protein
MVGGKGEFGDPEETWRAVYGLEVDGAVLVRPDGYIGWRSRGGVDDPVRVLTHVVNRILSRE